MLPSQSSRTAFRPASWFAAGILGLLAIASCGSDSGEEPQKIPEVTQQIPPVDPILGPALVINGEVIPNEVVRRGVLYGPRGKIAVEMKKLSVMMEQEVARRVAAGATREDFAVTQSEAEEAIAETNEELRKQYPDDDIELEDLAQVGPDGFLSQVKLSKEFIKIFLPEGDPDHYPAITLAALNESEESKVLFDTLKKDWEERQAGQTEGLDPFFHQIIFSTLTDYFQRVSNIEMGEHLPDDVLMRINGQDVPLAKVWDSVKKTVSVSDVRAAKQWVVNMKLLRKDLADVWLDDAEAEAAWLAHEEPFRNTMFTVDKVATMIKRFPTVDTYKEFRRAYSSYQKRIASELNPTDLKAFAEQRTKLLIGQTQVDVDVILVSAYDFRKNRWKENGWQEATARAKECYDKITSKELDWNEAVEQYSEFFDPPIPANQTVAVGPRKAKGRFRAQTRNALMQLLEESEFWQFLNGNTLTDYIFFDLEEGKLGKVVRGPHGWYIPLLHRRNVGPEQIIDTPKLIEMAEQDYTLISLAKHCQSLLASNQVYGLE